MFHEDSPSLNLFTSDERTSRSSEEVEYRISYLCTSFERLLMKCRRFFCRMFILSDRESFSEPDIQKINDIFENSISDPNFFIQYLMKISKFCRKRWLSLRAINTWFIRSVESDIWCSIHIVLDPETYPSWKYPEWLIERLYETDHVRITPHEDMSIFLCISESVMKGFFEEKKVVFFGFCIICFLATITFSVAETFWVIQSDIIRRVIVEYGYIGIRRDCLEEFSYILFIGRVSTHDPMISKSIDISEFCRRSYDWFKLFFYVKSIFLDSEHIVPDRWEFRVIESDIEKESEIKILQEFKVPFSRILIESQIELFFSVYMKVEIYHRNFCHAEFFRYLEPEVSSDHDIHTIRMSIRNNRIYETVSRDTFLEMLDLLRSMLAWIVLRRIEYLCLHIRYLMWDIWNDFVLWHKLKVKDKNGGVDHLL